MSKFLQELNNIYNQFELIQEAIPIDVAKKIISKSGKSYKDWRNDIFKGRDRIILDGKVDYSEFISETGLMDRVNRVLKGCEIFSKKHQENVPYPYHVHSFKDYLNGICYAEADNEKKNPTKIGKVLKANNFEETLEAFNSDPFRVGRGQSFKVVVSRHPYDIAGISTDRNWTSCMDLGTDRIVYKDSEKNEGSNRGYINSYIKHNALVAYLVSESDVNELGKLTLKKPVARILLYPFQSADDEDTVAYGYGQIYGQKELEGFEKIVSNFVDKINGNIENIENSFFMKFEDLYYDGDRFTTNFKFGESPQAIARRYKFDYIEYEDVALVDQGDGCIHGLRIIFPIHEKSATMDYADYNEDDTKKDIEIKLRCPAEILEEICVRVLTQEMDNPIFHSFEMDEMVYKTIPYLGHFVIVLNPIDIEKLYTACNDEERNETIYKHLFEQLQMLDNDIKAIYPYAEDILADLWDEVRKELPKQYESFKKSGKQNFADYLDQAFKNEGGFVSFVYHNQ
jgi:hypothetical protein